MKIKEELKMNIIPANQIKCENSREEIIALTPLWTGERFPDGRPKVEDKYLDALYGMTLEEVWKPIFVLGYEHQFVGTALRRFEARVSQGIEGFAAGQHHSHQGREKCHFQCSHIRYLD